MPEPIKIEEVKERVILVGVSEQDGDDAEDSVAELAELVKTAGAVTVGTLIQKRELIHPGTYVGTGKVQEIADMIAELGATGIVCDDELSPAQLKNLEQMLDTKVMDRTLIILDIFAARATTSEDPGRAGAVKIQTKPSDRSRAFHVKTWRWYRNQRPR
jgi:GTP-binding protein HflX